MILIYGDVHGNFRHVAHVVKEHRPDAIIFLGDIEAQRPFEKELEGVMDKTEVWWIHGNHDTDSQRNYDNLFGSALADRNLHGKVVEIDGLRVAGLGGVFRGEIWYPNLQDAPAHFDSYDEYQKNSEQELIYTSFANSASHKKIHNPKIKGKLLKHRSSIFFKDWIDLCGQQADILVTHEAPACHPHGFRVINELARSMKVKFSFHGHHHDRLNCKPLWDELGFCAVGVGFRGVTDQYGDTILPGEFDEARMGRLNHGTLKE